MSYKNYIERREKTIQKIRKQLGNDYHLGITDKGFGIDWALYKNYDDPEVYFSKDNKAVMTSKTHTLHDLEEFAKKHEKLTYTNFEFPLVMTYMILTLILSIANFWLKKTIISGFIYGINLTNIFWITMKMIKDNANFKIKMLDLKAHLDKVEKKSKELSEKCTNSQEQ